MRPDVSEVVFVIDENLGESAAAGIREAGGRCVLLTEVVGRRGTPDVEWVLQPGLTRYNAAQCEEKDHVQLLLRGLCGGIAQPSS